MHVTTYCMLHDSTSKLLFQVIERNYSGLFSFWFFVQFLDPAGPVGVVCNHTGLEKEDPKVETIRQFI